MATTESVTAVIEAVKKLRSNYVFSRDPCVEDVAERSGLHRHTVADCLNFLEQHSLVTTEMRENAKGRSRVIVNDRLVDQNTRLW